MNVSKATKEAYQATSIHKNLNIYFPELDYTVSHVNIYSESMKLKESILEKNSMEFVGCIASMFKIKVHGVKENLKGKSVEVSISTDDTEEIPLFHGVVDSAVKQSNRQIKEIVAYDELYTKGNIDLSAWYKSLKFPITLKDMRDSLFGYIGIEQVETSLPNDDVAISKQYDPNSLQALAVIKAVCQINGAMGIINRNNKFEYRILGGINEIPYPSTTLFPSSHLFPANPAVALAAAERVAKDISAETFSFYKKVEYEEYEVKPIDKVTIRQTENDAGVTYGTGTNNYIIQGNMFTYGLPTSTLITIAQRIYDSIGGFSYYPFTSDNNGLPFLECGLDAANYYMIDYEASTPDNTVYKQQSYYILNRELSGIQNLRDSYSAKGEEYQSEFITDLQTQIDIIKRNTQTDVKQYVEDYTYDKDYLDEKFEELSGGGVGSINVVSVEKLPDSPDENTIYLIQGEVVVE